tara:strand:+ start:715 stop:1551 length:837 start_codon:yes stop_codon:yes gene_type:complete
MEFYLSIDGEKQGPFPLLKVGDMLEKSSITEETLAWHIDQDGWKPVSEIPALDCFVETAPGNAPDEDGPPPLPEVGNTGQPAPEQPTPATSLGQTREVRPFLRFWARMFDYTLISVTVLLFSDISLPQPGPDESFTELLARYLEQMQEGEGQLLVRTQFLAMIGWHFVEAVLIHLIATTPGKALFGIRVQSPDGSRIPIMRSLGRSFYIYLLGVGFYQFPFILIGMTFSFFRVMSTGRCLWDQHLDLKVETPRPSPLRIVLAIFGFFVLVMLQSLKFS